MTLSLWNGRLIDGRGGDPLERVALTIEAGRIAAIDIPTLSTFTDLDERFSEGFTPRLVEQAKRQAEDAHTTLLAAHAAGVTLAMGYDSGPPASATELIRMAEGGIGVTAAIRAATEGSARALGLQETVGTVEVGRVADLLVVDGDPIAEPAVLLDPVRIWLVFQAGSVVAGEAVRPPTLPGS